MGMKMYVRTDKVSITQPIAAGFGLKDVKFEPLAFSHLEKLTLLAGFVAKSKFLCVLNTTGIVILVHFILVPQNGNS